MGSGRLPTAVVGPLLIFLAFNVDRIAAGNDRLFDFGHAITVSDVLHAQRGNRTSCEEIARMFLARIRLYNGRLGAVTVLNYRGALLEARRLDAYRKRTGRMAGRLHCVPTLVKDNILVSGLATTLGQRRFVNATARVDAPAVRKLRDEGALVLGKANLSPLGLALRSPDEPSQLGGRCRNPYAVHSPVLGAVYGSSCGNAVAQAARLTVIGLATDTAGSTTWPAAVCGLVSVRPPAGLYGTEGSFPLLKRVGDTLAPMAASVSDAILLLDILASNRTRKRMHTPAVSRPDGRPFRLGLLADLAFGQAKNFSKPDGAVWQYRPDQAVAAAVEQFAQRLRNKRVTVVNLTIGAQTLFDAIDALQQPWTDAFACSPGWAEAFLHRHPLALTTADGQAQRVTDLESMLTNGDFADHHVRFYRTLRNHSAQCLPSLRRLRKLRSATKKRLQTMLFDKDDVDVLAFPRPFRSPGGNGDNFADLHHVMDPAGAAGFPAMTLPIGFMSGKGKKQTKAGRRRSRINLPIGMYLMTRPRKFESMLNIALLYERGVADASAKDVKLPPEFV